VAAILRSNAPLRRLLGAWLQSCIGTGAGYVALLLLTTRYLHTSWAVAAVLLCDLLPAIAFGFWFGALADRYSKRALVVIASVLQAIAFGGLAFAHTAAPIFLLALLAGLGNAMELPALRSALPAIAGDGTQVASALYDTCRWVGATFGPLLAAGLFALSGVALPLAINGFSFVIAGAVLATVAMDKPANSNEGGRSDLRVAAGLREAFDSPLVVPLIASGCGVLFAGSLLNVCEPFLATRVLHGSGSDYALLVAAYGGGMVVASALVARGGTKAVTVLVHRYVYALALIAVGLFGSSVVGSVPAAGLTFAATGLAYSLLVVSQTQLILVSVPIAVQGRLFGARDTFNASALLLGLGGAAPLIATIGVRLTLATAAGVCGVCAVVAALTLLGREPQTTPDDAGTRTGYVEVLRSFP
jgi:MFS family permease